MVFGALKKAFGGAAREVKAEYGKNKDFLEAVCAASALVANADGMISDDEKREAIRVITGNKTLAGLYQQRDIESTLITMLDRSKTASGRQSLARELDDVKGKPEGAQMCEDIYLVACDVANADGSVSDEEKATLEKIARRIGVDPKNFEF